MAAPHNGLQTMTTDSPALDRPSLWTPYVDSAYVEILRDYVRQAVAPEADRIDRSDVYPVDIMKDLARHGYSTVVLEPGMGGRGLTYAHAVAVFEALGDASAAVGVSLITIYQDQAMKRLFAVNSTKQRYLPAFAARLLTPSASTAAPSAVTEW